MLPAEGATDGQLAEVIAWSGTVLRQPTAAVAATYDVVVDVVIVIAGIALTAFALALLARKARRGGTAGAALAGAMAAYNEAWQTTAYSTQRCNAKPIV